MTDRMFFSSDGHGRRRFLRALASGTTLVLASWSPSRSETRNKTGSSPTSEGEEVSPGEDLMRFIRMYNPHQAREDTVLFPALREIVTANEYNELGEDFERKEHELFGDGGFEKMVDRVAAIEKSLGIHDLRQFTPKE